MELTLPLNTERMAGFGPYLVDGMEVNYLFGLRDLCDKYLTYKRGGLHVPKILELGTHRGVSSELFANYGLLTTVDINPLPEAYERLSKSGLYRSIVHKCSFAHFIMVLDGTEEYDLIYIDGDHEYDTVVNDILCSYPYLSKGGVIAGHDYNSTTPGVKLAVDDFVSKNNLELSLFSDSSWAATRKMSWKITS
jgi:hypothetical protein